MRRFMVTAAVVWALIIGAAAQAQDVKPADSSNKSILERLDDLERKVSNVEKDTQVQPTDFRVFWKDGVKFETWDSNFNFSIGGRIFTDFGWFGNQSGGNRKAFGNMQDGAELRMLRLTFQGDMYRDYFYKIEMEFGGGNQVVPKDVFLGMKNIPYIGKFQVGHFKEPFSLEELTSDSNTTFLEKDLPNVFTPSRNIGMMVMNNFCKEDRGTWALGVFRETNDVPIMQSDRGYALTGRVTYLPWYEDGGQKLLHVGLGASYRKQPMGTLAISQRPEFHLAPKVVNTGTFIADEQGLINPEVALVYGPFCLMSEYMQDFVTNTGKTHDKDINFHGFYVEGSYFLTGESRPYDKKAAAWTRLKPKNNFSLTTGGLGALQLAARYSIIDLTNDGITGNTCEDMTLGVNWYLNPNMRVMANYIHSHITAGETASHGDTQIGDDDLFGLRFQLDF